MMYYGEIRVTGKKDDIPWSSFDLSTCRPTLTVSSEIDNVRKQSDSDYLFYF